MVCRGNCSSFAQQNYGVKKLFSKKTELNKSESLTEGLEPKNCGKTTPQTKALVEAAHVNCSEGQMKFHILYSAIL